MKKHVISIVATLGFVMAFQNCSDVAFENADPQLVTKIDSGDDDLLFGEEIEVVDIDDGSKGDDDIKKLPHVKENLPGAIDPGEGDDDDGPNGDDDIIKLPHVKENLPGVIDPGKGDDDDISESLDGTIYTCVVASSSVDSTDDHVIALSENSILAQNNNGMSKAVCMTENACLNIIAQRFEVKGVKYRQPCESNKNATRLSDKQIKELIK